MRIFSFASLPRGYFFRSAILACLLATTGSALRADLRDFTAVYTWNGRTVSSGYRIYVPLRAETPTIRAVVFVYPGSGGDYRYQIDDPVFQEAARSLDVALIGADIYGYDAIGTSSAQAEMALDAILSAAAQATARPELVNAPFVATGHSLGGFSSSRWAKYVPNRMIASVPQRGTDSPTGGSNLAASLKVPYLVIAGSADTNPVTNPNTISKGDYPRWRGSGAPDGHAGFAVDWTIDHDSFGNQTWALAWVYIAEAMKLRYPAGQLPSAVPGHPLALNDIALTDGWLGHRAYVSSSTGGDRSAFGQIAPYNDYVGVKTDASWLPNEAVARAYQAFNSFDGVSTRTGTPRQGPLAIVGAAAPLVRATPPTAGVEIPPQLGVLREGSMVELVVDPREFDDPRPVAEMRYYDGAQLLTVQTEPAHDGVWRLAAPLAGKGVHSFTVVATDAAGNKTSAFRPVVAAAPGYSALRYESDFDGSEYLAGSPLTTLAEDSRAGRFWKVSAGAGTAAGVDAGGAGGSRRIYIEDTSSAAGANVAASLDLSAIGAVGGVFRVGFRASASGLTPSTANGVSFSFGTAGSFTNFSLAAPSQSSSQWLSVVTDTTAFTPAGGGPTSRGFLVTILTARAGGTSIAFRPRQADGHTLATWVEGGDFTVSAVIDPISFAYRSIAVNGVEQIGIAKNSLNGTVIPADQFFVPASATPDTTFRFYSTSGNVGSVYLDRLVLEPVLTAPAGLKAETGAEPGAIRLSWTAVPAAERFELQRSLDGAGFATLAEAPAGSVSHVDRGLPAGQSANYRMRAESAGIWSGFSDVATAQAIVPDSYEGWSYLVFGAAATEAPRAMPAADPDGDGVANLIEYLGGRSATVPEEAAASVEVETSAGEKYLSLSFTRDPGVPDGELQVEGADDLTVGWQSLGALDPGERVTVEDGVPAPGLQTVKVRDVRSLADGPRRFLRLRGVLDSAPTYATSFETSSGYAAEFSVAGIDDSLLRGASTWTAVTRSTYSPAASSANPRSGALAMRIQKSSTEATPVGVMLPLTDGGLDFGRRVTFGFSVAINSYSAGTGSQFQVYLGDGPSFFPAGSKFWTALVFNEGEIFIYKSQGAGSNGSVSLGRCTSYAAPGQYLTFTIVFDPVRKIYEQVTVSGPLSSMDFTSALAGTTLPWLPGTPGDPPPLLMFLAGTNDALNLDIDDVLLTNPMR